MKLIELADKVTFYGPIALVQGHLVACGAAPEVWYETGLAFEEAIGCDGIDSGLGQLEVVEISASSGEFTNDESTLEIGLDFDGLDRNQARGRRN